jgi:O-antigen/teichoic acid export membrane protein
MRYLRSYARDGAYLALADGIGRGAVLVLLLLAARAFGAATYGELSVVIAVALALSSLTDLGVSQWLLRELVRASGQSDGRQEGHALSISAALSVITIVATLFASRAILHSSDAEWLALGATAYSASLGLGNILYARERSNRQLRRLLVGAGVEKIGLIVIGLWAVESRSIPLLGAAYGSVAVFRLGFAIGTNLQNWYRMRPFVSLNPRVIWPAVQGALPFAINGLVLSNLSRLDVLFVSLLAGPIAAAYFSVGDKVVTLGLSGSAILTVATMPILGQSIDGHVRASRRTGLGIAAIIFASSALATGLLVVLAPGLGLAKLGNGYAAAAGPVSVMLVAVPLSYAAGVLTSVAYLHGQEHWITLWGVITSVAGAALVILGTQRLGITGAALAYSARQLILCIGYCFVAVSTVLPSRRPVVAASEDDRVAGLLARFDGPPEQSVP